VGRNIKQPKGLVVFKPISAPLTTAATGFTAAELCDILDKAKALNVASLEIAGVKVSFEQEPKTPAIPRQGKRTMPQGSPRAAESGHTTDVPSLLTPGDNAALKEAQDAQALIEDPMSFEQTQIDAHLTEPQEPTPERPAPTTREPDGENESWEVEQPL